MTSTADILSIKNVSIESDQVVSDKIILYIFKFLLKFSLNITWKYWRNTVTSIKLMLINSGFILRNHLYAIKNFHHLNTLLSYMIMFWKIL